MRTGSLDRAAAAFEIEGAAKQIDRERIFGGRDRACELRCRPCVIAAFRHDEHWLAMRTRSPAPFPRAYVRGERTRLRFLGDFAADLRFDLLQRSLMARRLALSFEDVAAEADRHGPGERVELGREDRLAELRLSIGPGFEFK